MYADHHGRGAPDVAEMDAKLAPLGFVRQYCEARVSRAGRCDVEPGSFDLACDLQANNCYHRELNCLWTQRGRPPLWVTGRPQPRGRPAVQNDTSMKPAFRRVEYVSPLRTSTKPGALDRVLQSFLLRPSECVAKS